MYRTSHWAAAGLVSAAVVAASMFPAVGSSAVPGAATGPAPGAPGETAGMLPADKSGFGTAYNRRSRVWFTVQKSGGLGEVFYPDLSAASARALQFVVARPGGDAVRAAAVAKVRTRLVDGRALAVQQTFVERGGDWRLTVRYVTDPARATVLVKLRFVAPSRYRVYALFEPALSNTRTDDAGRTRGRALVATDGTMASAFVGSPRFTAVSSGFRGTSDGYTDLLADGRMDWKYASASAGNLVQTARTDLTGRAGGRQTTLALAFGGGAKAALHKARASLNRGFGSALRAYIAGWHAYVEQLRRPPASLRGQARRLHRVSAMVLAAGEDKTYRGAFIASPSSPWAFGRDDPSGPYHLVWSRDLYQIATGLIAAGDRRAASRSVDYMFSVQQKPDGSFPQNSRVDGTPVWEGLQLDEVALPIVLAWQLRRFDARTWAGVKKAADFLLGFQEDGNRAPWTPAERWENQAGYSPNSIATQIAGLVCAASIARRNGDETSARRYLHTADRWRSRVKGWTVTRNGPYSDGPYFLRLTKDGNPNAGTAYDIGDSGPMDVDQRRVVDGGYLDLVRLGVLRADDRAIVNTLRVIDRQLGVRTAQGRYWQRASFDGYGEMLDGSPWDFGLPDGSRLTRGRAWPLLNGERGEYDIAAGHLGAARRQIAKMARTAGAGLMLPEQVWDHQPPGGTPGFTPGRPTTSATPLTWTHAQYLRLVRNVQAGEVTEMPGVVARRYLP